MITTSETIYYRPCPKCKTALPIIKRSNKVLRCPGCGKVIFLVGDLFCGAGGTSTGAKRAVRELGAEILLVCVNHWDTAIATHQANHPEATHYIQDITVANPIELVPWGWLDLLCASPECTHFSRARGGKPVNNQSRMSPAAILEWLRVLDIKRLLVENVPEFMTWGPIDVNDQPVKEMKGIYFKEWIMDIKRLGYKVEYCILNAADYGDATTRRRFFLIARKDGCKVTFPKPTHSRNGGDGLSKWRAARDIIDWGNPGRSLLDDPKYIKRPLSINTRQRIASGFKKQGGALAPYFIRLLDLDDTAGGSGWPKDFTFNNRNHSTSRDVGQPIHGVTGTWNGGNGLVRPDADPFIFASRFSNNPRDVNNPIPSITNRKLINLVEGNLQAVILGQQSCSAPRTPENPIPTVATGGAISITKPELVVFHGRSGTQPVDKPIPSLPTHAHIGLNQAQIVKYHGKEKTTISVKEPLDTLTTKDRFGIIKSVVVPATAEEIALITGDFGKVDVRRFVWIFFKTIGKWVLHKLDILFRMLSNPELAAAHSFNSADKRYEFRGTVAEITKQIGNSVPCELAAALVKDILKTSFEAVN